MNSKVGGLRHRQNLAYLAGACLGLAVLAYSVLPAGEKLHAKGPMNTGHEKLACTGCHNHAPGSFRQQIQANLRYALGLRGTSAPFGRLPVGNQHCLACHERPNDRHPVYRFLEPRFAKVREELHPHACAACHAEHQGKRVTLAETGYCVHCHKETRLRKDPLDVSHEKLIALKRWDSCLGCHDFHGNHIMKTGKSVEKTIPVGEIRAYFEGGPSPYGDARFHKAKKGGEDD